MNKAEETLAGIRNVVTRTGGHWLSETRLALRIIRREISALVGFTIILFFALMASIGPEIIPLSKLPDVGKRFLPPSWEYPLGTDFAGRDVLAQIVHGSRDVLLVAFFTGLITVMIALSIGISSGYIGGRVDSALMIIADIFLVIPSFPLLLIIAASLPRTLSPVEVAFVISIVGWPGLTRAIRSQVLSVKEELYIESAKCLGLSKRHMIFREILPNLLPFIAMNLVLSIIYAIYSQVGLYFLGVMPYTSVNWGTMINIALYRQSALLNRKVWIYLFSPIVCIILIQMGFILSLHVLEEIFNPRLRTEEA
jgi:peptide/nickel transport system permease protein